MNLTEGASCHRPCYDAGMCAPKDARGAAEIARRLLSRAYKQALSLHDQQHLLAELERDSKLVYHIGLTPPKVIKNNY